MTARRGLFLKIGPETRNFSDADGGDGASKLSKPENFVICCCFLGWYPHHSLAYDVQDVDPGSGGTPPPPKTMIPGKNTVWLSKLIWGLAARIELRDAPGEK